MKKSVILCLMFTLIGLAMISQAAFAEEPSKEKSWEFNLTPLYFWGVNIEGDATLGFREQSAKIDFSDVFDNMEGVFSVVLSGKYKSKFGFTFDYLYLDVSNDAEFDLDLAVDTGVEVSLKTQTAQFAGTYSFGNEQHIVDVVAGVRYLRVDVDVDFNLLPTTLSEDKDLWDPIFGARYLGRLADKWNLRLYGDIGGFGVGSEFTWQAGGVIDFWPWKHVGFSGGYRALGYRFEDDDRVQPFELDLLIHGPLLGVSFRW